MRIGEQIVETLGSGMSAVFSLKEWNFLDGIMAWDFNDVCVLGTISNDPTNC